jgi:hypothetical protein
MNKYLQQGLLTAMIVSLAACGGSSGGSSGGDKKTPTTPGSAAPSSVASSPAEVSSSSVPSSVEASSSEGISSIPASVDASSSSAITTSSSSSSSSIAPLTTIDVRITLPELANNALLLPKGRTANLTKSAEAESVPRENLAVVFINLAGDVVNIIPLDENNSTFNAQENLWSITVAGCPRLDCIVIANPNGPVTLTIGANVFSSYPDALLAPTTGAQTEISLASTATYQSLLSDLGGTGSFADAGINVSDSTQLLALNRLIENTQRLLDEQGLPPANNIAAALVQVKQQVSPLTQAEAGNIQNQLNPGEYSLAQAVQTGGGIFWFEADSDEVIYGGFTGTEKEKEYYLDGDTFVPLPDDEYTNDLILTAAGWSSDSGRVQIQSQNADGSLTLYSAGIPEDQINLKASQTINLAERNIAGFLAGNGNTFSLQELVNPASYFGANALAYRANLVSTSGSYSLWYEPGNEAGVCPWDAEKNANDYGGNCETVGGWNWPSDAYSNFIMTFNNLNDIKSPDLNPGEVGAVIIPISWGDGEDIAVQLVDNAQKTARYYRFIGYTTSILIGEGTWSNITLPHLTADASGIVIDLPDSVINRSDYDSDSRHILFVKHEGFVRRGSHLSPGEIAEAGMLLLNGVAKDNLLQAMNYKGPQVGSWIDEDNAVITFIDNRRYAITNLNEDHCGDGVEVGYYQLKNGRLHADAVVDVNEGCGIANPEDNLTIEINGNTLTAFDGQDYYLQTRLQNNGIVGTWINIESEYNGVILSILPNNKFLFSQYGPSNEDGRTGYETGTYTWNSGTNLFVPTVGIDRNGEWGLSHPRGDIEIAVDGDTLTLRIEAEGVEENFSRVVGANN